MTYNEIIKECVTDWLKAKLKRQKIKSRMNIYAFSTDPHETCKRVNPNHEPTDDIDELTVTFGKDIRVVVSIEKTPAGWHLKTERRLSDVTPPSIVVSEPEDISEPPHDFGGMLVSKPEHNS